MLTSATRESELEQSPVGRQLFDSVLSLILAVIFFRAFALEGYIISTGSMAPTLLGYHKRIQCPDCGFRFAFGVAFDRESDSQPSQLATCPNCGQRRIDVSRVPRNDGDQLLVFKQAYEFRDPRRWETVVFLSPHNPGQAFVKRIVGLPGECIQIRNGDVFINGERQKKPLDIQKSLHIPVYDASCPGKSADWLPRWLEDPGWSHSPNPDGFVFNATAPSSETAPRDHEERRGPAWLSYFHWPRTTGRPGDTGAPGSNLKSVLELAAARIAAPENGMLDALRSMDLKPQPITDQYGYNRPIVASSSETEVHDLMMSAQVSFLSSDAELIIALRQHDRLLITRLDPAAHQVAVWHSRPSDPIEKVLSGPPLATGELKSDWLRQDQLAVDVSTFDSQLVIGIESEEVISLVIDQSSTKSHQLMSAVMEPGRTQGELQVAVDERLAADQNVLESATENPSAMDDIAVSPVRIGASRGKVEVRELRLFRDVHYTSQENGHAVQQPLTLGSDEFFVMGDNSPVSLDSRGWAEPTVPRHLLIGRPLVVHLPSRPGQLRIGAWERQLRIPDFSQIRIIR